MAHVGKVYSDYVCRQCGQPLVGVRTEFDRCRKLCVVRATCGDGHALEITWAPGETVPVEAIPIVNHLSVR